MLWLIAMQACHAAVAGGAPTRATPTPADDARDAAAPDADPGDAAGP